MRAMLLAVVLGLGLAACGDASCKNACDKLKSCAVSGSSGFSCDDDCQEPLSDCAVCVNDTACGELQAECGSKCPADLFKK